MKIMSRSLAFLVLMALVGGCGPQGGSTGTAIDQVPMYGGMNRQDVPTLKEADRAFIAGATSAFGDRQKASRAWADRGFRVYANGDSKMAMQRFNQAWLLDPENPESYWGFGLILRDRGDLESGRRMMKRAHGMGLREQAFLDAYAAMRA